MALTKVQAEGINLADAFAFTGSVTGASILQVKGTTSASESTTDSSSFVANGLSALSITPSSASNKVLILFGVHLFQASGGGSACLTLFRDSTDLNNTTYGWGYTNSGSPNFISGVLLDNPNTTSSVSYQIKHRVVSGSGNVYSQINNNTSTFTIMEIGSPILT